jgi:hypothetical protein
MKKYNVNEGKDELFKALLLMKYDTKKTLSENKENIKNTLNEDVPGVAVGSAVGGAGLGVGAAALGAGTLAGGSVGTTAMAVGSALGAASGGGAALALGAAVLGGAAAVAVVPLAYWLITKDNGADRVKKFFDMCSTNKNIEKLERKINDGTIRDIADSIYDSIEGVGTDEESLFQSFNKVSEGTASDVCRLVSYYNTEYGDLWDDLDSDIDAESEWNKIYRPLRNCVEDSLLKIKEQDPEQKCPQGQYFNPKTNKCQATNCGGCVPTPCPAGTKIVNGKCIGGGGSWKDCKGTYTRGCKSDVIAKVQKCLGLTSDGKFGPKTDAALKSKGFTNGFTDEDVTKICNRNDENTTTTTYPFDPTYAETNDIK